MKNVIFDFGNVVISWDPYRALNGIFATRAEMDSTLKSIGFFDWNLEQDRGRSWEDGVAAARQNTPEHAHIFAAYADGLLAAHDELVPGTSELIQALHDDGVPLFGLTNASLTTVRLVKSVAPALGLMQDIVASAAEGVNKPDPKIYEICLSRNQLDRRETLFVDDSLANCEAAISLGLQAHHFVNAGALKLDLQDMGLL
ncbi:MAG: HAD family hydrolase [Paracoccaceae bacterium]